MASLRPFVLTTLVLGVSLVSVSGCDSCRKGVGTTKALFEAPPPEEVQKQTTLSLRTAIDVASELCGFPAGGLTDVKVEVKSQVVTSSEVHVSGISLPMPEDAGLDDDDDDAGNDAAPSDAATRDASAKDAGAIKVARAVVCAGVLKVVMDGDFSEDLQARTNWHVVEGDTGLEVTAIETPGVTFDEARHRSTTGSGGHHHHHHH